MSSESTDMLGGEQAEGGSKGVVRWYKRQMKKQAGRMLAIGDGANDVAMIQVSADGSAEAARVPQLRSVDVKPGVSADAVCQLRLFMCIRPGLAHAAESCSQRLRAACRAELQRWCGFVAACAQKMLLTLLAMHATCNVPDLGTACLALPSTKQD